jgi:hypothetical protein
MTGEAIECMRAIEILYEAAGRPQHDAWHFDAGVSNGAHAELQSLGLLSKLLGTEKGFAWRLTSAGVASFQRAR